MQHFLKSQNSKKLPSDAQRLPVFSDNDINFILVNGAQMALIKLKRGASFNARIYYYAEIGVYLEVSLSSGAGITDESREQLTEIHNQATRYLMDENKQQALKIPK